MKGKRKKTHIIRKTCPAAADIEKLRTMVRETAAFYKIRLRMPLFRLDKDNITGLSRDRMSDLTLLLYEAREFIQGYSGECTLEEYDRMLAIGAKLSALLNRQS